MDTYYTQKWVGLRDKRLATLYYLGLLLVTSMLLVRLGWQQAYVDWDHEISGVVRPRLKAPAPAAHERERAYCAHAADLLPEDGPMADDFAEAAGAAAAENARAAGDLLDKALSRLLESGAVDAVGEELQAGIAALREQAAPVAESEKRRSTRCETWDELDLQEASQTFGDGAIFIPTRVQERLQEQDAGGRKYVDVPGSRRVFFVAGVDELVLRIKANVEFARLHRDDASEPFQFAFLHSEMAGAFVDAAGAVLRRVPPGQEDEMPVAEWLRAGGFQLGDASDADPAATFRDEGAVLQVALEYSNAESISVWSWLTGARSDVRYTISVQRIAKSEYKHVRVVPVMPPSPGAPPRRLVQKQHGVYMRFVQRGRAGRCSVMSFGTQLLYGLGSLALVTTVIDLLWQYLLPALTGEDYNAVVIELASGPSLRKAKHA